MGINFFEYVDRKERVLFCGKGPSAENAVEYSQWGHLAVVNEAGLLFPDQPIEALVATDRESLLGAHPTWQRTRLFVLPIPMIVDRAWPKLRTHGDPRLIPGFPIERAVFFSGVPRSHTRRAMARAVKSRIIGGVSPAIFGQQILVELGYKQIWMFGFDGGAGYAGGLWGNNDGSAQMCHEFNQRLRVTKLMSATLKSQFGVDIRYWPDRFID